MTTARRTRLSREARRAQLIELGVQMLATRQLDELTVEVIASAAGISRGLLFHYFSSKQEFHAEVARAAAAEMIRRTEPDPDLPALDALRSSLDAFVDYVEANADNYRSLVRGAASGDERMRAISSDTRQTLAARTIRVLGGAGGALPPAVELTVHGWVAHVEECVLRWLGARPIGRAELVDLLTGSLPALLVAAGGNGLAVES